MKTASRWTREAACEAQKVIEVTPCMDESLPLPFELQPPIKKQKKASVTTINNRLIEAASLSSPNILYQHTILCQTGMPYRDPGDTVRDWERENGIAKLSIEAGKVVGGPGEKSTLMGLPFGPKPRLILAHINTEAILAQDRRIRTERSLTAFISGPLGMASSGRNVRMVKEQLMRLSVCTMRLSMLENGERVQINAQIADGFRLLEKNENNRVLWPSEIILSESYFLSLQAHAVPLDAHHLAALSHSSLGIDVYCWLAQRLHRINPARPDFVDWNSLAKQFGLGYDRIRAFRTAFLQALTQVKLLYKDARLEANGRGLTLWNSPPPVAPRLLALTSGSRR